VVATWNRFHLLELTSIALIIHRHVRQLNLNPLSTGWRGGQDGQIITSIIRKPHVQRLRRLSPTSFNPSPTTCIQHFDSSNGKLLKACLVLFDCHRRLNSMTVPCFIFQVVQVVASGVLGHWWWLLGLARRTGHESAAMLYGSVMQLCHVMPPIQKPW